LRHDLKGRERPQQGTGCDSGSDRATVSTLQTLTTWMSEETESADHGLDYSDLSWNSRFLGAIEHEHANDKIECYELNINDLSVALEIRYFKYFYSDIMAAVEWSRACYSILGTSYITVCMFLMTNMISTLKYPHVMIFQTRTT
jgi:hypothetical protein